jgi:hypothetical protein
MFDSIIMWLNTIPIEGPVRAIAIIGIMLGFSGLLFGIWEGLFAVIGKFKRTPR